MDSKKNTNTKGWLVDEWLKKCELTLKTLTIIATVWGALWGLKLYLEKRQEEIDVRNREYRFANFKEQKETLYPLCKAAAEIIACDNLKDAEKPIRDFNVLYYGELSIISKDTILKNVA